MSDSALNRLNEKRKMVNERKDSLFDNAIADEPDEYPEYSRVTIKMEVGIDTQVRTICSSEKLSKEAFIEAACDWLLDKPGMVEEVLALARKKAFYRKQVGTKRRAKTLSDTYIQKTAPKG
jgi:hypothetical protein